VLPPVLTELAEYFAPLSTYQREENGAVTLLTPGVNVLGLNATYVAEEVPDLDSALAWHAAHGLPPLLASLNGVAGTREVATLDVGTVRPAPAQDSGIVVEQISRLHLQGWAEVLTAAHGTPGWATSLARHLAARLEGQRDYLPLLAYSGAGKAVGALLWQAANGRSAAHLWGALSEPAASALLTTATALGHGLRVSLPTTPLLQRKGSVDGLQRVKFTLKDRS
jgi:hypothetical protein